MSAGRKGRCGRELEAGKGVLVFGQGSGQGRFMGDLIIINCDTKRVSKGYGNKLITDWQLKIK